jgi:iron complex outermembrane receptor protein
MRLRLSSTILISGLVAAGVTSDGHAQGGTYNNGVVVLDPITITARRREEAVQDAPVAVTVIPGQDIGKGKVDTLEDSAFRSPNTIFSAQGGPFTIRGVGSLGIDGGVDRQPAVGVFVDDVYIARPFGYPTFLTDTNRVEVVRGSQATLYGKNTIGGAVNLIMRDPGTTPGVEAEGTLGTGPAGRLQAAFDAPLGSNGFYTRGFAAWTGQNGYIANLPTGKDVSDVGALATRFVTTGRIGEATDVKLSFDYSRNRDDGGLWYAPLPLAFNYQATHDLAPSNKLDIGGLTGRIDHNFDLFRLTSITAFRGHKMDAVLDGDFTPTPFIGQAQIEDQRQFSQDIRFASTSGGPLRWTGGLYYMHERFDAAQFFDLASVPRSLWSRNTFNQSTDTYSAFGEIAYRFASGFEFIGGLRYTYEAKDTVSEISSPSGTFMFGMPGRAAGTASFDNLSPEFTAVYHFSPGNQTFAKVSRGFKSGGISPYIEADGSANRYQPELTTSYEVGAKTTWLDGRLTVNGSVFYVDWTDQQTAIYTTPFTRVIRNASAATSKGFEIEAAARVTEYLTVSAGYGYLDAKYDSFVDTVLGRDYSGNSLPYAPNHSVTGGLKWRSPLSNELDLVAAADYAYRTGYSFTPDNNYRQGDTHIVDASIGVQGKSWSATLWTKNLLDERYLRQYFNYAGTDMGVAALGRTVGLTVAARW